MNVKIARKRTFEEENYDGRENVFVENRKLSVDTFINMRLHL